MHNRTRLFREKNFRVQCDSTWERPIRKKEKRRRERRRKKKRRKRRKSEGGRCRAEEEGRKRKMEEPRVAVFQVRGFPAR